MSAWLYLNINPVTGAVGQNFNLIFDSTVHIPQPTGWITGKRFTIGFLNQTLNFVQYYSLTNTEH